MKSIINRVGSIFIIVLILSISNSNLGYAQEPTRAKFDFRNTNWGMTKVEVKATEFNELIEDKDNMLIYADVIGGDMNVIVAYIFEDVKLFKGKYLFHNTDDKNDHISDYKRVKETLTLKYGSPKSDEEIWTDEAYKEDPGKWESAVRSGHLAYKTVWETGATMISLVLHGDGANTMFGVIYSSKKAGEDKGTEQGK
jgi:hypothetical protein